MATRKSYSSNSYYGQNSNFYYDPSSTLEVPTFTQIASFFGLCVCLSASENVLPSMVSEAPASMDSSRGFGHDNFGAVTGDRQKSKGMVKALVDGVRSWVGETSQIAGFQRTSREKY
ncbi:erv26 super protein [Ascosphaera aggregata]|nr:erv26 super protein [Ascosphaera aggregata]